MPRSTETKRTLMLKMKDAFRRVNGDTRTRKDVRELDSTMLRLRYNYGMKYKDLARVAGVDLPEWEKVMQSLDMIPI